MSTQNAKLQTSNVHAEPLCDLTGILITSSATDNILELDIDVIKHHVRESGAVVFKGFNLDAALFEQFSDSLSNDFMNNMGSGSWRKTKNYSSDGNVQKVPTTYSISHQRTVSLPLNAERA